MIKAVLLDFDGTLVSKDLLDVMCALAGKEKESEQLNRDFHAGNLTGRESIIKRINFLKGISITAIHKKLEENPYLTKGAKEFIDFLNKKGIVVILQSGNIIPILQYYQKLLGIDYLVGTIPKMNGDSIAGIGEEDFPGKQAKLIGVKKILENLSIDPLNTIAIGDSPADKIIFDLAGKSIAIDPKGNIAQYADHVIYDNLTAAIKYF